MIAAARCCGQVGRFPCAFSRKIAVLVPIFRILSNWEEREWLAEWDRTEPVALRCACREPRQAMWVPVEGIYSVEGLLPPRVNGGDVLIGPAEVMGKFMHHHMGDQIRQTDIAAFHPFFQNGTTKKPDRIGLLRLIRH